MTVILGYMSESGDVWIGADGRISMGSDQPFDIGGKLRQIGDWTIGTTGDLRLDHLLEGVSVRMDTTALEFANAIREAVRDDDWDLRVDTGSPKQFHGEAVFGRAGTATREPEIYRLSCNFALIAAPPGRLVGVGSGRDYAIGAWWALGGLDDAPAQRMKAALLAACALTPTCGEPCEVRKLGELTPCAPA